MHGNWMLVMRLPAVLVQRQVWCKQAAHVPWIRERAGIHNIELGYMLLQHLQGCLAGKVPGMHCMPKAQVPAVAAFD